MKSQNLTGDKTSVCEVVVLKSCIENHKNESTNFCGNSDSFISVLHQ